MNTQQNKLLIVSGSDSAHFANLRLLVGSWLINMHSVPFAVCDYGLTQKESQELTLLGIEVLSSAITVTHPWQGKSIIGHFIKNTIIPWESLMWIDADAIFTTTLPDIEPLIANYDMIIDAHVMSVGEITRDYDPIILGLRNDDAYFSAGWWIVRKGCLLDTYEKLTKEVYGQGYMWEADAFVAAIYQEKLKIRTVNGNIWHSRGKTSIHTCKVDNMQPFHVGQPIYILHANDGYTKRADERRIFIRQDLALIQEFYEDVYKDSIKKLSESDLYTHTEKRASIPLLDINSLQNNPMIAVVRLDNIGDHVLSSGFLKGLRLQLPHAHITVFVSEFSKKLYEHCPHIDRLIVWPLLINLSKPEEIILDALKEIESFCLWQFDIVINPRFGEDFYQAAELAKALGAPIRIAFEQKKEDTNKLYTHLVTSSDNQHVSEYANILLQALFGEQEHFVPEVWYGKFDESQAHKKLLEAGWNGIDELLMLAPGARDAYRALPLKTVMELIERLHEEHHICVVIVGGSDESEKWNKLNELMSAEKYINAVGLFTLSELAACFHFTKTKLFVGTDSGPKHIAAAAGLEVIEIGYFPKNWPSLARGMWASGECWQAFGVNGESIRPETLFSQAEVFNGLAISSITSSRIVASINEFWHK